MGVKPSLMARDFRRLRTLAEEILRQCDHYERNMAREGGDDDIRALIVSGDVRLMSTLAGRMERRWRRERPPAAPGVPERGIE